MGCASGDLLVSESREIKTPIKVSNTAIRTTYRQMAIPSGSRVVVAVVVVVFSV